MFGDIEANGSLAQQSLPPWNMTNGSLEDLASSSHFLLLLFALSCAITWFTYITFYSSRVAGLLLTYGLKRFTGSGAEFIIGSISLSILSGKLMFRNVVYITPDYTLRVQDGWITFRWWNPYKPKAIHEDMSRDDSRMSILINGLELHIYNRSALYSRLEALFGLESLLIPSRKIGMWKALWRRLTIWERRNQHRLRGAGGSGGGVDKTDGSKRSDGAAQASPNHEMSTFTWTKWRDFFPVVKIDLVSSRFVFGNHLLPTTLSFCVEEAKCVYTSRAAQSPWDLYMHSVKGTIEGFKMMFSPSPKYTSEIDEPPRFMGEGYLVFSSNSVDAYYYWDEPGFVVTEPRNESVTSQEEIPLNFDSSSPPVWGLELKCGKNTDISYGPWVERQRDLWMKFFFPWDYQQLQPTKDEMNGPAATQRRLKKPAGQGDGQSDGGGSGSIDLASPTGGVAPAGVRRQPNSFDLKISLLEQSSIDILFSKQTETQAIHMRLNPGSYLDITVPLLVDPAGYTTVINGQFLLLETTTGLSYRTLLDCETLEYTIKIHHPLEWNDHQDCTIDVTVCKGTVHLTYVHKNFIQEMIDDWSSKSRPDILSFIPYTWHASVVFKQFEVLLPVNEYNWLDCTSKEGENYEVCICGDMLNLSIVLPFTDFLPETVPVTVSFHGDILVLGMRIPPAYTSHAVLMALQKDAKIMGRDGKIASVSEDKNHRWRNVCNPDNGWVDCVWVPIAACKVDFIYHPMPPIESLRAVENYFWELGSESSPGLTVKKKSDAKDENPGESTLEREEKLLFPIRAPTKRVLWDFDNEKDPKAKRLFRPDMLPPDKIHVELEFGATTFYLYGTLFRLLWFFKDDFLGEYQTYHDMETGWEEFLGLSEGLPATEESPPLFRKRFGQSSAEMRKRSDAKPAATSPVDPFELRVDFDPRHYRPLLVTVSVIMHDIHGTLVSHSLSDEDAPCCPVLSMEQLAVEVHKSFRETKLQVNCSPISLKVWDKNERSGGHEHLSSGVALLTAFQFRGDAMFSDEDRQLTDETVEYAWLVEVQLGHLMGRLTLPQIYQVITSLNTFALLVLDSGNYLKQPPRPVECHHGVVRDDCPDLGGNSGEPPIPQEPACINLKMKKKAKAELRQITTLCPTSEDIKYRMVRLTFDSIDLVLVEEATALQLEVYPIRMATCNAHGESVRSGLSLLVENVAIHQYVAPVGSKKAGKADKPAGIGVGPSDGRSDSPGVWLEAGAVSFGPIHLDAALSPHTSLLSGVDIRALQQGFLCKHDARTRRLWFLWINDVDQPSTSKSSEMLGKCGCVGGCAFFGRNMNGKSFFKPTAADFKDGCNVAQYRVFEEPEDHGYGFGQSLLVPSRLVFEPSRIVASGDDCRDGHDADLDSLDDGQHSTSSSASTISSRFGDAGMAFEYGGVDVPDPGMSVNDLKNLEEGASKYSPAKWAARGAARVSQSLETLGSAVKADAPKVRRVTQPVYSSQTATAAFHRQTAGGSVTHEAFAEEDLESPGATSEGHPAVNRRVPYGTTPSVSSVGSTDTFFSVREDPSHASRAPRRPPGAMGSSKSSYAGSSSGTPLDYRTASEGSFKEAFDTASEKFATDDENAQALKSKSTTEVPQSPLVSRHGARSKRDQWQSEHGIDTGKFSVRSLRTNSSASFISANSTLYNEDDYPHPDFGDRNSINLIDLHAQVNKPVTESPLLMSGYTSHLVQVKSKRWACQLPPHIGGTDRVFLISSVQEGHLPPRSKYFPEFLPMSVGFTAVRLVHGNQRKKKSMATAGVLSAAAGYQFPTVHLEEEESDDETTSDVTPTHLQGTRMPHMVEGSAWDADFFAWRDERGRTAGKRKSRSASKLQRPSGGSETEFKSGSEGEDANDEGSPVRRRHRSELEPAGSQAIFDEAVKGRTTVVFKVKSPVDICFTPLAIESLQRFTDSLTDTLRHAHPMVIVDLVELLCTGDVGNRHVLLQDEKVNLWADSHSANAFQAARMMTQSSKNMKMRANSTVSAVLAVGGGVGSAVLSASDVRRKQGEANRAVLTVMEESRRSEVQALVVVPKINITILQTSLVEFVTSFSGLDHFQDLLCVSVLALSMDQLRFEFYQRQEDKLTLQAIPGPHGKGTDPASMAGDKLNFPWFKPKPKAGSLDKRGYFEPLMVETVTKSREEALAIFSLSSIHTQLRRLTNECSLLEEAAISAIDPSKSKVTFSFAMDSMYQLQVSQLRRQMKRRKKSDLPHSQFEGGRNVDELMGFIMCEAGMDNIKARLVFQRREFGDEPFGLKPSKKRTKSGRQEVNVVVDEPGTGGSAAPDVSGKVPETQVVFQTRDVEKIASSLGSETDVTETLKPGVDHETVGHDQSVPKSGKGRRGTTKTRSSQKRSTKRVASKSATRTSPKARDTTGGPRDSTTCAIDFESVWFNFAAPPTGGGISRKVDFSKLDWNFLSTASPAISAWQGPVDRLVLVLSETILAWQLRRNSVMACLMTGAIDPVYLRMPAKSKHSLLSLISRTIQEDPGCQICTILRKYFLDMTEDEHKKLLESLDPRYLPRLDTLKKGIVALTKQLKHGLYVPMVLEQTYRHRALGRLALPPPQTVKLGASSSAGRFDDSISVFQPATPFSPGDKSLDSLGGTEDLADDNARLLSRDLVWRRDGDGKFDTIVSAKGNEDVFPLKEEVPQLSSRLSYGTVRARPSFGSKSLADTLSIDSGEDGTVRGTRGSRQQDVRGDPLKSPEEDLYWKFAHEQSRQDETVVASPNFDQSGGWNTLTSNQSTAYGSDREELPLDALAPGGAIGAVDVHFVFKFLLSCLGIAPQQIGADAAEKRFGGPRSVASVSCCLEQIRVHIAEAGRSNTPGSVASEPTTTTRVNFSLETPDDQPAFVCEGLSLQVNGEKIQDSFGTFARSAKAMEGMTEKVMYVSRRQLKNSISDIINVQVDVKGINQKVNLPLLRLVQHIVSMCQNAAHVQKDLREARTKTMPYPLIHQKNSSSESGLIQINGDVEAGWTRPHGAAAMPQGDPRVAPYGDTIDSTIVSAWREEVDHVDSASYGAASATSGRQKFTPSGSHRVWAAKEKGYEKLGDLDACDSPRVVRIQEQRGDWIEPAPMVPECWKSLYHLINLYAITPETKTITATKPVVETTVRASPNQEAVTIEIESGPAEVHSGPAGLLSHAKSTRKPAHRRTGSKSRFLRSVHGLVDRDNVDGAKNSVFNGDKKEPVEVKDSVESAPQPTTAVVSASGPSEKVRMHISGVININRIGLTASLSGLKLEGEIRGLCGYFSHRRAADQSPALSKRTSESTRFFSDQLASRWTPSAVGPSYVHRFFTMTSASASVKKTSIVLLEGAPPKMMTVVRLDIGRVDAGYSNKNESQGWKHSARKGMPKGPKMTSNAPSELHSSELAIESIKIDIPQHPVMLHSMMARSSKHLTQLSNTLQELRVKRTISRLSRGTTQDDLEQSSSGTAHLYHLPEGSAIGAGGSGLAQPGQEAGTASHSGVREPTAAMPVHHGARRAPGILQESFTVRFSISLKTLSIQASLLPSLQAQYVMDCVKSSGVTGSKAKFSIEMAQHCLSFSTKLHDPDSTLPPSASIALPRVEVWAQYVEDGDHGNPLAEAFGAGVSFCPGNYLNAEVRIGGLVHNLTTDVLNHLVFVQKVFMKEINEVLQKMTSGSNTQQPQSAAKENKSGKKRHGREPSGQHHASEALEIEEETGLLYLVVVKFDGIQITATTPTSSAVRLQTGLIEVQVSNRVKNSASVKLFCHAGVNINVSLGQVVGPPSVSLTDADFQQFAFFKTRIVLRNAFQEELGADSWQDMGGKDVILISLDKPRIFVLPVAVDRAIMVWLNYRNAYEYWTEQRATLKREVLLATQQFMERVPNLASLTGQQASYLFLMLTVKDLGICLPINAITQRSGASQPVPVSVPQGTSIQSGAGGRSVDMTGGSAVMISLQSTSISACSYGSLVSNGAFESLCMRFEDEFDVSRLEWKPDWDDPDLMNFCVVASGTYQVCSRTTTPEAGGNPKWLLNVSWRMDGVDIHVDTDIGKQLSTLASTLTSLTEVTDEDGTGDVQGSNFDTLDGSHIFTTDANGSSDLETSTNSGSRTRDSMAQLLSIHDGRLDDRERSRLSETQMVALVKKVNNLREAGVRRAIIEAELQKIRELEKYMSSEVRKGWMKKLRRQSVRGLSIRDPRHVPSLSPVKASKSFTSPGTSPYADWERHFASPATIPGSDTSGESESSTPVRRKASSIPKISLCGSSRSPSIKRISSDSEESDVESDKLSPSGADDVFDGEDPTSKSDVGVVVENKPLDRRRIKSDRVDYESARPSSSSIAAEAATRPHTLFPPGRDSSRSLTPSPDGRGTPVVGGSVGRSGGPPSISGGGPIPEPLIDFECDVTVLIKSGSCVLHSKEHGSSGGDDSRHRGRKETGGNTDTKHNLPSPSSRRKHGDHSASGVSRLRPSNLSSSAVGLSSSFLPSGTNLADANMTRAGQAASARNTTVILVPGLDVKAHYDSKTEWEEAGTRGDDEDGSDGASMSLGTPHLHSKIAQRRRPEAQTPSTESSSSSAETPSISVRHYDGDQDRLSGSHLRTGRQRSSFFTTQQHSQASGGKKARLFAAVNIHSVPEEILLSPHILDFLEQALEPLPLPAAAAEEPLGNILPSPTSQQKTIGDESESTLNPDGDMSGGAVTYAVGSSFPVDVMVSFHMKPSVFRFTCEPVSKVECLLKLPSLDLIFSRKRAEDDLLHREFGDFMLGSNVAIGGLSVAGCMADFSLYIFHPYGKKTQVDAAFGPGETPSSGASLQDRKDSLSVQVEFVKFNLSRSWKFNKVQGSAAETMTSRGSFSMSQSPANEGLQQPQRPRRGQAEKKEPRAVVRVSTVVDIGSATFKYDMKRLAEILGFPKAWYRRSIVRRLFLGDTMARQGSASGLSSGSSAGRPPSEPRSPRNDFEIIDETGRKASAAKSGATKDEAHFIFPAGRRGTAKGVSLFLPLSPEKTTPGEGIRGRSGAADRSTSKSGDGASSGPSWETLVVFAVNFQKLSIQMNMSNVMGNVLWLTKGFLADGRLSIGSSGHKDLYIGVGLENSNLDAKGGIIGGAIDVRRIDTSLKIKKEPGSCPKHMIGVNLFAVEGTIENVGTSVMMGRISSLQAVLRDQWVVSPSPNSTWTSETAKLSKVLKDERPTSVHLCGDLEWDQFQLMITQSTTTELMKMYYKLSEFFSQQLHSGRIVISSLQHDASGTRRVTSINEHLAASASPAAFGRKVSPTPVGKTARTREVNARSPVEESRDESPLSQHRHWQKALSYVRNLFKSSLVPDGGLSPLQPIVLGGSFQMHGSTISLACFHGLNFRSQSWALFSLKHPFIAFNTEAQDLAADPGSPVADTDVPGTHVVQQLTFSLGDRAVVWGTSQNAGESMATVCRISRSMTFPPKCRTIHDWFHYAFATGQLDDVDRFPYAVKAPSGKEPGRKSPDVHQKGASRAEAEASSSGPAPGRPASTDGSKSSPEPQRSSLSASDYYQSSEVLFALPGLQLDMKSEHIQKAAKIGADQAHAPRPVVECSFITEFDDHIFVTVDAQGFFFLHDLICSYVQDEPTSSGADEKGSSTKTPKQPAQPSGTSEARRPTRQQSIDPIEILQKDAREFICKLWQMEPTVRFISWGGKHIEPYGVDYILQKLGFRHARITIPKWLQRGCLDPLDKLLSVFVFNLLTIHMKPASPLQPQLQPVQQQEQQQKQTPKPPVELQLPPKAGP